MWRSSALYDSPLAINLACSTARADLPRNGACKVSWHSNHIFSSKSDRLWPVGPLTMRGSSLRHVFEHINDVTQFWSKRCNGRCLLREKHESLGSEIWRLEYRMTISFEIYVLYGINHVKKKFQHSGSSRQGLRQFFLLKMGFPWRTRFCVWQICSTDHVHDPPTFKLFFYMI